MSVARKVVILGTGGTIAGQGAEQGGGVGYTAGQIDVLGLLRTMTGCGWPDGLQLEAEQVAQLDSKDMDIPTWQQLAHACAKWLDQEDVQGIVVTHGTDTLEETAWFLQSVLQPAKPVVMTCAMRPATALSADGPANLRDAVVCALQNVPGVWVTALGEVHSAQAVRKVHPYRVHAFSSGSQGASGWVEEGQVRWGQSAPVPGAPACDVSVWRCEAAQWPWVEIVTGTAAARPEAVDALVAAGVQGLVLAVPGNGSVHQALQAALYRAMARGVSVWRTTRCEQGQIVQAPGQHDPMVSVLSPVKARISLMLELLHKGAVAVNQPTAALDQ